VPHAPAELDEAHAGAIGCPTYGLRVVASLMEDLVAELKKLIVEVLLLDDVRPVDIDTDAPLLVEGLGLDSIDSLELAMAIGKRYSIKFRPDEDRNRIAFGSVRALAAYIEEYRATAPSP